MIFSNIELGGLRGRGIRDTPKVFQLLLAGIVVIRFESKEGLHLSSPLWQNLPLTGKPR